MSEKIPGAEKKILCGILGILLGSLGIHKFILGYTKEGIIQIVVSDLTCGFGGIIGFIEGIIYLTKSDEDFVNTYVDAGWRIARLQNPPLSWHIFTLAAFSFFELSPAREFSNLARGNFLPPAASK